jgi:hypothetical protein
MHVMVSLQLFDFLDAFQQEGTQVIQILEMVIFRVNQALNRKAPCGPAGIVNPAKSQKK